MPSTSSSNQTDQRAYDVAASEEAQDRFNHIAAQLEDLIERRDADVKTAMAAYAADGVSDEYAAREVRWNRVGGEVKGIIRTLRSALASNDGTAQQALAAARGAVQAIG